MAQKAPSVDWRRLRAGDPLVKSTLPRPPYQEPQRSTSEGDMNRGSFRESMYDDHFMRAVANDDGTPIAQGMEELLAKLLGEIKIQNNLLRRLIQEVEEI